MKQFEIQSSLLVLALLGQACGTPATTNGDEPIGTEQEPIIFGADDRTEYLNITDFLLKSKANATAAVIGGGGISCSGGTCSLTGLAPYNSGAISSTTTLPLCDGVRFKGQLGEPHCTAFLVGPDTFATAGHCMVFGEVLNNPVSCTDPTGAFVTRAAFGFNADAGGNSPTSLPSSNVYSCVSIQGKFTSTEDWAVFKVDRVVTGRAPMIAQYSGALQHHELAVFGHGEKLPLKMSRNAFVKVDSPTDPVKFSADADIFSGNSGGPGVDVTSGVAVGITVTGPFPMYVSTSDGHGGQCATPRVCSETNGCPDWTGHTRMTYVTQQAKLPLHAALFSGLFNI